MLSYTFSKTEKNLLFIVFGFIFVNTYGYPQEMCFENKAYIRNFFIFLFEKNLFTKYINK